MGRRKDPRLQEPIRLSVCLLPMVKEKDYQRPFKEFVKLLQILYNNCFLLEGELLSQKKKSIFQTISEQMPEVVATMAIHRLSRFLCNYYGKR